MHHLLKQTVLATAIAGVACSCSNEQSATTEETASTDTAKTYNTSMPDLPPPNATESSINFSHVIGWEEGEHPTAPSGFKVTRFAAELDNPRWIYVAPNGDIFVAESNKDGGTFQQAKNIVSGKSKSVNNNKSANRITLFRDNNNDGKPEMKTTFYTGLDRPFGMLILNGYFYLAATDGIWRFPYQQGDTALKTKGEKIATLPAGGYNNHWTRNIIAAPAGDKIFVSVGSGTNVGEQGMEHEVRRAAILSMNADGSGETIYASGLRNPVGMAIAPGTNTLFTVVNERDELGDDLVPDYLTSVKKEGFYGWPYSYFGQHKDPRWKDDPHEELVTQAIVPDYALGAHTASLGLAFFKGTRVPDHYKNGALIGQHGSWNRSVLSGYKVVFVPFEGGSPSGKQEDFLTGFVDNLEEEKVHGRPVGVAITAQGAVLVADDAGNTVWHVAPQQ